MSWWGWFAVAGVALLWLGTMWLSIEMLAMKLSELMDEMRK